MRPIESAISRCSRDGRRPPLPADASVEDLVRAIVEAPRAARRCRAGSRTIRGSGVPLSPTDFATIRRFHGAFIQRGLDLQFNSHGRPPQSHYPTLRDLIVAEDRDGRPWHYLAAEADYQFVRHSRRRPDRAGRGRRSGPDALRAIGRTIAARGERVSAFYISNVESDLYRDGAYGRFLDNLNVLPRDARSVMIRSIFGGARAPAVQSMTRRLPEKGPRRG